MKKINVYYNKYYLFSTTRYNTIKELKNHLASMQGQAIYIAYIPQDKKHIIDDINKYQFAIVHN